jgi:osmoprotectant transport system permease protein
MFDEIVSLTLEHVTLVASTVALSVPFGVGLGLLLTRRAGWRRAVLGAADMLQTIPSLAMFGFLIPVPLIGGIGRRTAIVALVLYALLPILRNTVTGVLSIDPAVRESAEAMGLQPMQILRLVELPLAFPTILAGVRIATVTTIGTATIAAVIGGGGLGVFIFRGVASVDAAQIMAGAIPAALLALAAEGVFSWLEGRFSPY